MSNSFDLMMFRFNLWAKPFFPPPQSLGPGMENSSYLPNPLTSPALMVLASTAEASREGNRLPAQHPFPGQSMRDKDGMVSPYSSSFPAMYRQGDPFPSPLYAPLPPFVRPSMDRGVSFINPAGVSAFRPVTSTGEVPEGYHSAFTPAKRSKHENSDISGEYISERSERTDGDKRDEHLVSPVVKEERPSCENSPLCDTNSESLSEHGDFGDRGTPDEGRTLRRQRKRNLLDGQTPCCPVCGITLRTGEIESHYIMELEKLDKISRNGRKLSRDFTPQGRKGPLSPSTSRAGRESPVEIEGVPNSRFETYLRIKCNRQNRLSARSRSKRRKPDEAACPICNEKLTGTPEELNGHVEQCLKRRGELEDEPVDVEGDGDHFEEYTWAGQTRVRATTMLQGGFSSYGFQIGSKRLCLEEDVDLNVDGDDSEVYGKPQYSEVDVIPCSADEPAEDRARQALRGAVIECGSTPSPSASPGLAMDLSKPSGLSCENGLDSSHINNSTHGLSSREGEIIKSLKAKLKEQDLIKGDKFKCLICMECYTKPLVSTQCWHVHCEECWLRTLGAKKLCPQCNMITSPTDLRRLFL